MSKVHTQAREFCLAGDNGEALLFIHGITASPSEIYPAAQLVHEKTGAAVKGILLPGHGTSLKDLSRTRWTDWFQAVEDEIGKMRRQYNSLFLAGLSLGGLLSLYAAEKIADINGVVSINAPIFLKIPAVDILAPVARLVCKNIPKAASTWNRKLNEEGRFNYNATPIDAFQSMWQLRHKAVQGLKDITIPLLIIQSRQDETVRPSSGRFILVQAVNAPAELLELELSRHVATMDREKGIIADKIAEFMAKEPQNIIRY